MVKRVHIRRLGKGEENDMVNYPQNEENSTTFRSEKAMWVAVEAVQELIRQKY